MSLKQALVGGKFYVYDEDKFWDETLTEHELRQAATVIIDQATMTVEKAPFTKEITNV